MLRNGEQLLLAVVIPVLVLVGLVARRRPARAGLRRPGRRRDHARRARPGGDVDAFTSLAIATGFERRYGVLKRLGSSPLPRSGLLAGKVGALLLVEAMQLLVLSRVGLSLGWAPAPGAAGLARRGARGAARHRGVRRARPAAGRRPARRGDAGRREPGLPAAARRRARWCCPRRRTAPSATSRSGCPSGALGEGMRGGVPRRRRSPGATCRAARLGGGRHRRHGEDVPVGVTAVPGCGRWPGRRWSRTARWSSPAVRCG